MNKLTELRRRVSDFFTLPSRKSEKGATLIEYAAIIVIIAGVVTAIVAIGIPQRISQSLMTSITDILQSGEIETIDDD